jgi:hypothetical protein
MPDVRKSGEHDCFEPQGYPSSSAPKLTLFVCGDQFLCSGRIDGASTLRIDKRTYEFSVCAACSRPDFAKQMTVSAILGVFHRRCEAFLVVVTEAVFVGMVCGASVYCVRGAKLLPFELQASPEKLSRSDGVSKEATELEQTLSTGGFYFSYEVDLSCQLFATTDSAPGEARGNELGFSDEFCWNRELSEDLRALPAGYQSEWATALIHGSVQADNVNLGTDVTLPLQLKKKEVNLVLIARRSRLRCWPRDSVGLDEEGQSGGLVSVQLILEADILVSSLHLVMGSCPILWDIEHTDAGKRVRVKSVTCCRDALLHHVRHLRRLARPTLDVALLSVERGAASSSSSEDASLRRALDAAINAAERVLAPEEGVLRRGMLEIKSMPQSRNSIEQVESGLKTAGCKHAAQCAVHHSARDVSNDGAWKTRPQHILCRLHGGYGMVEGGSECLSLASTAAAIALLAIRNLFSEAGGKKGWCGGVLEQLLPQLCQHCANNLHRQATGLEAELEEPQGGSSASSTSASVASTFAGLTGGRASSLWRKACETVTYLTSSSYATLLEEEAGGVHMLAAEARSATALKARLRWRQHGRLSARHDALWQQQTLRVMCGSFNCKGKTIARKLSLHLS